MSLRTNLSTRPFYSERAVQAALALVAIVVVIVTVFNMTRLLSLTGRDRRLVLEAEAAEARTDELRRDMARARSGIDAGHNADIASAAHEANQAIDRRAFSWTELFNQLEAALPRDVRIAAVSPRTDKSGQLIVVIEVRARSVDAIGEFFAALEKAGTFHNLLSKQERETAENTIAATLEGVYTPPRTTTEQAMP
jgi:Tfp pilus assembly protein PilN